MYLNRKIDRFLLDWKSDKNHSPLIIKGARQIGKTQSIEEFAKNYGNFIEINFAEQPKYKSIIENGYAVDDIIGLITRIDPSKKFIPNNTLIFFDELQDFPEIATSLKFFKNDGRYDVICSGSLLDISYKRIESNSVGYKTDYTMQPMDFEEFLWAKGYNQSVINDMLDHMVNVKPFSNTEFDIYNNLFLDYCILGGMPKVVCNYIEQKNFSGTLELQKQLILDYKEDIRKYASGVDQTRILNVYNHIVPQLAQDNKKFQITKVAKGAKFADYRGCIEWLVDTGIVNISYQMNFPELPIKGNYDDTKYKLYYFDTGLLVSQLDDESQADLRANKNLGVYKGAIYENIVAESLIKQGYDLCYYKKEDSRLEEDFFVRDSKSLIPLEVKASNNTSKSLVTLIDSEKYSDIKYGIKLAKANIGFNGKFYTFPYFVVFLLKRYLSNK